MGTWLKAQKPLCHCFNEEPITGSLVGGGDEEFGSQVGGRRMFLVTWMIYCCSGQAGWGREPRGRRRKLIISVEHLRGARVCAESVSCSVLFNPHNKSDEATL